MGETFGSETIKDEQVSSEETQDDVLSAQEDEQRARKQHQGKMIQILAERPEEPRLPMKVRMESFKGIYSHDTLLSDMQYVKNCQKRFEQKEKSYAGVMARNLELFFLHGVQGGRWLGNVIEENGECGFSTKTAETAEYDDYYHRMDAFTQLKFNQPISDEKYNSTLKSTTIGFDVTVSRSESTILEKMTRCSNNKQQALPFGFSGLKYYAANKKCPSKSMVVRYVVGLNSQRVEDLAKTGDVAGHDKILSNISFDPVKGAEARLMILSEMQAENKLYRMMLPNDDRNNAVRMAHVQLHGMQEVLDNASAICAIQLLQVPGWVPENRWAGAMRIIEEGDAEKISEYAQRQMRLKCLALQKERSSRKNDSDWNDTYLQIIDTTQKLLDAAKSGRLDEQKQLMPHTTAFDVNGQTLRK